MKMSPECGIIEAQSETGNGSPVASAIPPVEDQRKSIFSRKDTIMKKALILLSAILLIAVMAIPAFAEFDLEDFTLPESGVHFGFNGDAKADGDILTGELVGDPTFVEGRDGAIKDVLIDLIGIVIVLIIIRIVFTIYLKTKGRSEVVYT